MLTCRFRWVLSSLAAFLILTPSSRAGGVRIVEPTGTQNFPTIQAAVNAAPEGSVILVGEGAYPGFQVNGKSLTILAVPGATVTVGNWLSVAGIQAGQVLTLGGLQVSAQPYSSALTVSNSPGQVRFQDCQFRAHDFLYTFCPSSPGPGVAGAMVTNCDRVLFSGCTFRGGKAEDQDDSIAGCTQTGPPGGAGLLATGSAGQTLVLYDCSLQGGEGGGVKYLPGEGGPGASFSSVRGLASGTTFTGGPGGLNYTCCNIPGYCDGDGGPGCALNGAALDEIGSTFQGGYGGYGNGCTFGYAPGVAGGSANSMAGPARRATVLATVQSDASAWSVSYQGAAGDRPLLLTAASPQVLVSLPFHGAWALRRQTLLSTKNFGLVQPDGSVQGTAPASNLPAGSLLQRRSAQIAVRATNGVYLGSPKDLLLLDRDSGPDCNGNGVSDFLDVIEGTSADANHNLIPDSCPGG